MPNIKECMKAATRLFDPVNDVVGYANRWRNNPKVDILKMDRQRAEVMAERKKYCLWSLSI